MNLFTFNFSRKTPWAFLFSLVLIFGTEYVVGHQFEQDLLTHEVDWTLYSLNKTSYHADYLLLGDSVGLQLSKAYYQDPKYVVLATNKAIEPTGQYFIIQRYLAKNPVPKAVIFIARPFLDNNLDQVYTENFVLRTFTHWNEIYEIFTTKQDLTILAKMLAYKIFSTYKYKLRLQEKMLGSTNANIYSGIDTTSQQVKYHNYSFIDFFDRVKDSMQENASLRYLKKILFLLQQKKIEFYYIPAPISAKDTYAKKRYRSLLSKLHKITKDDQGAFFFKKYKTYPASLFVDGVHLDEQGMVLAKKFIANKLTFIKNNQAEQEELIQTGSAHPEHVH
jgi:hypothetical protein